MISLLGFLLLLGNICNAQEITDSEYLEQRSNNYIEEGKLDSAMLLLNHLLLHATQQHDTLNEIRHLSMQAEVYYKMDSLEKALDRIGYAKNLAATLFISEQNTEFADICQYYGAILIDLKQREKGRGLLLKSIKLRNSYSSQNDTLLGYAYNKLGTYYWIKQVHDSSLYYYQKALEVSLNKSNPINSESASYNQNVGFAFLNLGNYKDAEKYLLISLDLKQKTLNEDDLRLARIYLNLGYFYFRISLTKKALTYNQLAEQIFLTNKISARDDLVRVYLNIGSYYILLGDFSKALIYLNKALNIINEYKLKNPDLLYRIYADIGYSYFLSGNYELAIENYIISLATEDESALVISYRNLARSYEYLGDYKQSEHYYNKAIDKSIVIQGIMNENLMLNYSYYANLLYRTNRETLSLELFKKSLKISNELYRGKSREKSLIIYQIGQYYFLEGSFEESLPYFQQSLITAIPDFSDSSILINPSINNVATDNHLYKVLRNKARALFSIYITNIKDRIYLEKSIETYELAIEVSKKLINAYSSESSQLEFLQSVRNTWDFLLMARYQIFLLDDDYSDKLKLFSSAEESKANLLLNALRKMDARSFGNIPHTLIEKADDIKKELSYFKKLAFEENLKEKPDESKMTMVNNGIFGLKTSYDSLVSSFEKDFPSYYNLKYDDKTISVDEIQNKLGKNQVLIEYALTDSLLLSYLISNDEFDVHAQTIDTSFFNNIGLFRKILSNTGMVDYDSTDYANYVHSGNDLYNLLLQPFKSHIKNKELIIIPDGEIGYLSFDMLLSQLPQKEGINYRTLDYALKEHTFSYSSSATIHFTEFGSKKGKCLNQLLAFAPNYEEFEYGYQGNYKRDARKNLTPIPGVEDEVNNISEICNGKVFLNNMATEREFKELSEGYNILHLAMHTIIDDSNPLYSHLVFAKDDTDTLNDGYLNTYELFNMDFCGDLAVLSACNTGTGKLEKGEGIMSLARGFIYSGIPSIVMTLWTVEDQPSANLITSFYQNLADGMPKAIAMNRAKLDYLQKAGPLEAHPYFWAGYVNIGDISPLSINARNPMLNYLWGLLIIPAFVVIFVLKRRKKNRH